jgi:hypothetical protein
VDLPNGSRTLLSACYDLFGLTEDPKRPGRRSRFIRELWTPGGYEFDDARFRQLRDDCLARWHSLFAEQRPDVALCSIHGFKHSGLDAYWQRHGIAAGSAALSGGLVVGAAHFREALPREVDVSPLAATRVPKRYLGLWAHRPERSLRPLDGFEIKSGRLKALVRLFEA